MSNQQPPRFLRLLGPLVVALGGALAAYFWILSSGTVPILPSLPGQDGQPDDRQQRALSPAVDIRGAIKRGEGTAGMDLGEWPRFRGPDSSNVTGMGTRGLAEVWADGQPEILWQVDLGEGHAAPSVCNGRVYILDYDEASESDTLRCLSLDDGRELWQRSYRIPMKRNHGLSRTIPAVTDNYVVTLGPRCHVMCVSTEEGAFLWGIDLQAEYGTKEPFWYAGQCPLIDEGVAVLAPAGPDVLLMGVDCATGTVLWKTPNPDGWQMSHSSIMPMMLDGVRMYIYCALGGVIGVGAEGEQAGQVLWTLSGWTPSVIAPSPVVSEDGLIFLTAGYGAGSALVQIARGAQDGEYTAEIIDQFSPREGLASEQQTPILSEGILYGILPKDAGGRRNQFVCAPLESPRSILAGSGKAARFGLGPYLLVDKTFLILNDDGALIMTRMSPEEGYRELSRRQILQGRDAWGPLALVGDRLLLRDDTTLACVVLPTLN